MMTSFVLAYLAGALTILSPCVLPLLPIVLGGALNTHRLGPAFLALGLVLSFTAMGLFVATSGFALGLTPKLINQIAAALMIGFGVIMVSANLQARFALVAATATNALAERTSAMASDGLANQFLLGAVLGAVWTPCVGPTLGAATALAAQGQSVGYAAAIMFLFAVGTATPLLALMTLTRDTVARHRQKLGSISASLKSGVGVLLIVTGFLFLTGLMSEWESFVLDRLPPGLVQFIYGF